MSPSNNIDILLVEDDADDLELTLRALHDPEVFNRIQVARDGQQALDYLFAGDAGVNGGPGLKLILLDLKLPRFPGMEVLRKIKDHPRTRIVPVVILTSSKQDEDLSRCYELGANSYIQKPVDFDEFQESIRQVAQYWVRLNLAPPHQSGPWHSVSQ